MINIRITILNFQINNLLRKVMDSWISCQAQWLHRLKISHCLSFLISSISCTVFFTGMNVYYLPCTVDYLNGQARQPFKHEWPSQNASVASWFSSVLFCFWVSFFLISHKSWECWIFRFDIITHSKLKESSTIFKVNYQNNWNIKLYIA